MLAWRLTSKGLSGKAEATEQSTATRWIDCCEWLECCEGTPNFWVNADFIRGRVTRGMIGVYMGKESPLYVIAINELGGGVKQASHLLKYDFILGTFDADVKPVGSDINSVDGKEIKVVFDRNPC
ncbi:hypothetical protein ACSQ67_000650 [Phaseolus vulgaris]